MIKGQDVVILLKLIANPDAFKWPQSKLAQHLCMSVSTINASFKRLNDSSLIVFTIPATNGKYSLVKNNVLEFVISSVKYFFYEDGCCGITGGIPTSYSWLISHKYIMCSGRDNFHPIWPYAEGTHRGYIVNPLYPSVPKSVSLFPDTAFYTLLCLVDVLRCKIVDRRSKNIATVLLKELFLGLTDNKQIV